MFYTTNSSPMLVTSSVFKLIFILSNYQTCTFPLKALDSSSWVSDMSRVLVRVLLWTLVSLNKIIGRYCIVLWMGCKELESQAGSWSKITGTPTKVVFRNYHTLQISSFLLYVCASLFIFLVDYAYPFYKSLLKNISMFWRRQ